MTAKHRLLERLGLLLGVDDTASLMVDWDNGSGLNVVYGEDLAVKIGDGDND